MIVYRKSTRLVDPQALVDSLCHDQADCQSAAGCQPAVLRARDILIHFGEIESALVDAGSTDAESLRAISIQAARYFLKPTDSARARLQKLLIAPPIPNHPIRVNVPEGYAYYGLFPETYAASGRKFFDAKLPAEVVCIGIRSIGTSLSAVVAAALEQRGARVYSWTARPEGHPFDRQLSVDDDLECAWRALSHAWFAIVDEGPGLSGSSFTAVAARLASLGIPDRRIVFFPSWTPSGDRFVSESARARWPLHEKYCSDPPVIDGCIDISAGKWRSIFYGDASEYPIVQPQHEARKFLCSSAAGTALKKFAGLGEYGEKKFRHARLLAEHGFCPPVLALDNGYLVTEFVPGQPLSRGHVDRHLLERIAQYIAFRAEHLRADEVTPVAEFSAMIEFNTGSRMAPPAARSRTCITDGRMLPHEWIATPTGYLKTDAIDHGDNHFYPGPTDIAWDLAGAICEFDLNEEECEVLIDNYVHRSADRSIRERLAFFTAAYLAFRIGYATMNRFHSQAESYRNLLEREVTASV